VPVVLADQSQGSAVTIRTSKTMLKAKVRSFRDLREQHLVRQGWDISCGAAALSTILTYDFDSPYSEATIALSILSNTDPAKIKERGGFSLLDLKRFVEAVGYVGKGFAGLTLDDLAGSNVPVILGVRIRDFDHFVVYRGRFANRVLLGDPAFGNLTLSEERFAEIWPSGIGFFIVEPGAEIWGDDVLEPEQLSLTIPDLSYVHRITQNIRPNPFTRRSISYDAAE
jgi:predicted double-glycine peptidase